MLKVNLADLARAGSLHVDRAVSADDPLWGDLELDFGGPVRVDLEVTGTPTGQVVARGSLEVLLVHECRRCLTRVERPLVEEVAMVWTPPDELAREEQDESAELRLLEAEGRELDMGAAVREELILTAPNYILCTEECRGLCPRCGINRNVDTCDCTLVEPDPRWDALRELKDE